MSHGVEPHIATAVVAVDENAGAEVDGWCMQPEANESVTTESAARMSSMTIPFELFLSLGTPPTSVPSKVAHAPR